MSSADLLRCDSCGGMALVVHGERPLCIECFMAQVSQTREQTKMIKETRPLSYDQLKGISNGKNNHIFR